MTESLVAIGLGSNLGDRQHILEAAREKLLRLPECCHYRWSPVFETAAVDCPDPRPFLNAAACFTTTLSPSTLLLSLLDIESRFGRERPYPNAPRPLDLDILIYGDLVCDQPDLIIPHPRMHQRLFVLTPLVTLLPNLIHPTLNKTVSVLEKERRQHADPTDVIRKSQWQWVGALPG